MGQSAYALTPHLPRSQLLISDLELPSAAEKLDIFHFATQTLEAAAAGGALRKCFSHSPHLDGFDEHLQIAQNNNPIRHSKIIKNLMRTAR